MPPEFSGWRKNAGARKRPRKYKHVMRGLCHAQTQTDQSYWCPSPWQSCAGAVAQPADRATGPRLTLSKTPCTGTYRVARKPQLFFGLSTGANRQPVLSLHLPQTLAERHTTPKTNTKNAIKRGNNNDEATIIDEDNYDDEEMQYNDGDTTAEN
jgi:hypothetical protein